MFLVAAIRVRDRFSAGRRMRYLKLIFERVPAARHLILQAEKISLFV